MESHPEVRPPQTYLIEHRPYDNQPVTREAIDRAVDFLFQISELNQEDIELELEGMVTYFQNGTERQFPLLQTALENESLMKKQEVFLYYQMIREAIGRMLQPITEIADHYLNEFPADTAQTLQENSSEEDKEQNRNWIRRVLDAKLRPLFSSPEVFERFVQTIMMISESEIFYPESIYYKLGNRILRELSNVFPEGGTTFDQQFFQIIDALIKGLEAKDVISTEVLNDVKERFKNNVKK